MPTLHLQEPAGTDFMNVITTAKVCVGWSLKVQHLMHITHDCQSGHTFSNTVRLLDSFCRGLVSTRALSSGMSVATLGWSFIWAYTNKLQSVRSALQRHVKPLWLHLGMPAWSLKPAKYQVRTAVWLHFQHQASTAARLAKRHVELLLLDMPVCQACSQRSYSSLPCQPALGFRV